MKLVLPGRRDLAMPQFNSMEAASSCCEHIHRSLMKVPGLLGQQLLTPNKAAVITEHCFFFSSLYNLFIAWSSSATRVHHQCRTDGAHNSQT